jgi:hypothetical protein
MIISENNWINDNITESRLISDYDVKFNLYSFKPLDFHTAAEQAAIKISKKYQNLYVGLSGGIDSEYVLVCFHKLKIPIIPLIILCEGNEQESKYAFKMCEKLNIIPKVIICSTDKILDICINFISKKINGIGFHSATRAYAANYVKDNNGTLVCGDHIIGDGNILIRDSEYAMNEWDGYDSAHFGDEIGFFTYTPELAYSMISGNTLDGENMSWKEYKSKLFELELRDKIRYSYPERIQKIIASIRRLRSFKTGILWKKNEILDIFKPYLI